jgi:hypothetical protein
MWQPIQSAPHDGTPVLLGRFKPGDEYDGRVRVDWWRNHMRDGYIGFGHFNPTYWPPTHWMPIPERPDAPTTRNMGDLPSGENTF